MPVLGSGHPLADVFLLKYGPQPAEVQEGVAFYGRAGQAVLKSLQRLHVDPMAIYGTNCLKFAGGDDEEAQPWLTRELHIVQPKLVVVMGEDALAFLNAARVPARRRARADTRRAAAVHADDPGALRARHRRSRWTSSPRRRRSGTRSRRWAPGGPSFRRTDPARGGVRRARGRGRRLLRQSHQWLVRLLALVGHRLALPSC